MKRAVIVLAVLTAYAAEASALNIVPHFINGSGLVWTNTEKDVMNQAAADWEAIIPYPATVNVDMVFGTGSFLGRWQGGGSFYLGTNIYPWTTGIEHTITVNTQYVNSGQLWFDPSPTDGSDLGINSWDALSVLRHEMGHMMGFTDDFYSNNFNQPGEVDRWGEHVVGSYFDPSGLNVHMESDHSHISDTGWTADDLMVPSLVNGERRAISYIDRKMLALADGYNITMPRAGDLNFDSKVDVVDLGVFATHWRDSDAKWEDGDFNGNHTIDIVDLGMLATNWKTTSVAAAPEPAALAILTLGAISLLWRRS